MGTSYYWKSNKYKVVIYIGRNLSPENMDFEKMEEILKNTDKYDSDFGDDLYTSLKEKGITELTVGNLTNILKAANLYCDLCLAEKSELYTYIIKKLISDDDGEIINDGNDKFDAQIKGCKVIG